MLHHINPVIFECIVALFWIVILVAARGTRRLLGALLALVFLGLLVGCTDPDPLPVASGPLYPLNVGYWQPTQRDLTKPPPIAPN